MTAAEPVDPEEAKARIRAVFEAAAPHFDAVPVWDRFGAATVERAGLRAGMRVLDVCCGTGASALPAARAVAPGGSVVGVDFAESLLAVGRAKAAAAGLGNVRFEVGDLTALGAGLGAAASGGFDAVVCVFGVFFAPDMPAAAAGLWRAVGPGGTLAVTSWGRRLFEPVDDVIWAAVAAERPDLVRSDPPWRSIREPASLAALLAAAGAPEPVVDDETTVHPITPDDVWAMVQGSGYRGVFDAMGPAAAARVRKAIVTRLADEGVTEATVEVLYARAARPA